MSLRWSLYTTHILLNKVYNLHVLCICTPRTYWANTNGCPGISLDLDNTNGGLSGAETMTLTDSNENQVSCDWSRAVVLTSDWSSTGSTASP